MRPCASRVSSPGASRFAGFAFVLLAFACTTACRSTASATPPVPAKSTTAVVTSSPLPVPVPVPTSASAPVPATPLPAIKPGGSRVVEGRRGVVVTVEANATRAGVEMLEKGGNAADAIVAAAYALAVTHPSAGNLGGGGFLLYRPRGGPTVAIDFREASPRDVTQASFDAMIRARAVGPAAAAVPGSVAGLDLTLRRFGRLKREAVLSPAVTLARKGFRLGRWQARTLAWAWPDLSRDPAARAVFAAKPPKGGKAHAAPKPLVEGDLVVQPELAATLDRIVVNGDAGFYEGETAQRIAALRARGGMVSEADLASYRAIVRDPLRTTYRGYAVEVAPPPSAGGVAVATMLRLFEKTEAYRYPAGSADALHVFAEVARRAHAIRRFEVVDPDSVPNYDLAAKESEWLDAARVLAKTPPIDPAHATPSAAVHPLYGAAMRELEHTTHLCAVDAEGNVASLTTTLSANFGAKVMAAGMVLNNSLAAFGTAGANLPSPGRRMTASMSPTLVLDGDTPVLVLGTPGGDTIPNTIVSVLRNVIDYGMTIDDAVDAPRIHQGFVPDEVRYETAHPPAKSVLRALQKRGHHLSGKSAAFGDANSILLWDGTAYGYADPREIGLALAAH